MISFTTLSQARDNQAGATAIDAWAPGYGSAGAYLQAEAGARVIFWQQAAPAQAGLEQTQAAQTVAWWQAAGPALQQFATAEAQGVVTLVQSSGAAVVADVQALDVAWSAWRAGEGQAEVAAVTTIAQAAMTDVAADAQATLTYGASLGQAAASRIDTDAQALATEIIQVGQAVQAAENGVTVQALAAGGPLPAVQDEDAKAEAGKQQAETKVADRKASQQASDAAHQTQLQAIAEAEAAAGQANAQAGAAWARQRAQALLQLQQAQGANEVGAQADLQGNVAQQMLAAANANQALALVKVRDQGQRNVDAAQQNLAQVQLQPAAAFAQIQPQAPASIWQQVLFYAKVVVLTVAVTVVAWYVAPLVLGYLGTVLAAGFNLSIFSMLTGVTVSAQTMSYVLGLSLFAGVWWWEASNRAAAGQNWGEQLLGGLSDMVGLTSVVQGGRVLVGGPNQVLYDPVTGTNRTLTTDEAWTLIFTGSVQLATVGLASYKVVRGLWRPQVPVRPPTLPNTTRGWKVGDPLNNLTASGKVPSWSAIRQRFWKSEAALNPGNYNRGNLTRMQKGLAPQRINPRTGQLESMELHHTPPQRNGGLFDVQPVWPDNHALIDPFRITGK